MGAAFDKWLAKPGTLHFLRRLVISPSVRPHPRGKATTTHLSIRLYHADVTQDARRSEETYTQRKYVPVRRGHPDKFDAPELGLQMSLSSGVAILDKDGDHSQAFSELKFQSDVNVSSDAGKRLVDCEEHRDNARLWMELLRFRQRIHGLEGVSDVWQGMRKRSVDLPVEGPEADFLWKTFLDAGVGARDAWKDKSLLWQIFRYAKDLKERIGQQYQELYKCIVGRYFRLQLRYVKDWHDRFSGAQLTTSQDLASVVMDATCASDQRNAFRIWMSLGQVHGSDELYDIAINELLNHGDPELALRWHRWLISDGHGPSTSMFETAGVQKLFERGGDGSLPMIRSSYSQQDGTQVQANVAKPEFPQLTRASMNTIVGDVHGIRAKEISDSFCARLFATRAFSPDLVIRGLSFLSIESLGPLTIRELAVRTGSPQALNDKLKDLNKLGIQVGTAVFAQLVAKAAYEGDNSLWSATLESDQHPDVFEDAAVQEALVTSFLQQEKFDQAHLALLALSMSTSNAHLRGWNRVFQHHTVNREYDSILSTMRSIQSQGLPLTLYSITLLSRYMLAERRRSKLSVTERRGSFDGLKLVRNACVYTAFKGYYVPINMWVELLKRYGMSRRWAATERLALWLIDHYAEAKSAVRRRRLLRRYLGSNRVRTQTLTLRLIFSPAMLQALVTWAFRGARNGVKFRKLDGEESACEPWARGLTLLHRIQERKLFDVKAATQSAFQQRMWVLFGAGYSTLEINNLARLNNRISLAHYINHANEIWNGLIDWVDPELLQENSTSDPKLLTQFFGSMYRTKRSTGEYADVTRWAAALSNINQSHYTQPRRARAKERAWKESTLRVLRPNLPPNLEDKAKSSSPAEDSYKPFSATKEQRNVHSSLPQEHQSPSARSWSSRPPPSPRYIPAPP